MKNKKKRLIAGVAAAVLAIWVLWGNTALEVNEYVVESDRIPAAFSGFRIVQVSDLHNAEFGNANGKLLAMISGAEPDIIVITGDLVDSRNTDVDIALAFARAAVEIAPVYYVTGNHEARVSEYGDLKAGLRDAGVTVLENEKLPLERDGETITLMGVDDPSFRFGGDLSGVLETLTDGTAGYTVLLSHRPELFDAYVSSGVDLVFSGHAHGGQFRLPFVGGLVAPNQGLFPKYDAGAYLEGTTTMIVSRGIGNSIIPLRVNNRPEVVVVQLDR